jgi:hypothetical protein
MFRIDPFSTATLRLDVFAGGERSCATATGLLINFHGRCFLATNWHVVTGRHPDTGELNKDAAIPRHLRIWHRAVDRNSHHLGVRPMDEPLFTSADQPRWIEPANRRLSAREDSKLAIDVVLLPLERTKDCVTNLGFGMDSFTPEAFVEPGSPISIVGYPMGYYGFPNYPIWKTGHIASDIHGHPDQVHFLVDATTREGMSGSPVIARNQINPLLGFYSGRLHGDVEIGIVWRIGVLYRLLEQAFK